MQAARNSEFPANCLNILYFIEHENDKLNKEVSSEDVLVDQDHFQSILPFWCKQEFVALIYMNELGLNLPGIDKEPETVFFQIVNAI